MVETLTQEYDLARAKVQFKDIALPDVQKALQSKQVSALLVAMPITQKYLSIVRGLFKRTPRKILVLFPSTPLRRLIQVAKAYESYDVPKGTLRGWTTKIRTMT